jgi:hypothetical protein
MPSVPLPSVGRPSMPSMPSMSRFTAAPEFSSAVRRRNYAAVQRESAAMGVVNAASIFFPVFLVRIGGTDLEVGLLTAIPAMTGFLLAIPIGTFLQARRNIVPWYSVSRGISQLVYVATAIAVAVAPANMLVPVILLLWALVTIPTTLGSVAFNVVMDGAAGPRGRYDLLGRRWSIMGLTTAITVAISGEVLNTLGFALNYQLVFFVFSVAGLVASWYSIRIEVPDHPPVEHVPGISRADRMRDYVANLRTQPPFLWFIARQWVWTFGVKVAAPLIPLWYVRGANAPDDWIGLIGTVQSLTLLVGYYTWRRIARRTPQRLMLAVVTIGVAFYPLLLVLSTNLVVIAIATAYGAALGAGSDLVLFEELMKTVPPKHAVSFSAVQTSLINLAAIIAPLSGGALAEQIGIGPGLAVGAVITAIGALLFITAPKRTLATPSAVASPSRPAASAASDATTVTTAGQG